MLVAVGLPAGAHDEVVEERASIYWDSELGWLDLPDAAPTAPLGAWTVDREFIAPLSYDVAASPIVAAERFGATVFVERIDARSGVAAWQTPVHDREAPLSVSVASTAILVNGTVLDVNSGSVLLTGIDSNSHVIATEHSTIVGNVAFDRGTGAARWTSTASPRLSGGELAFAAWPGESGVGTFGVLDPATGTPRWQHSTDATLTTLDVIGDVAVLTFPGHLTNTAIAHDSATGEELWRAVYESCRLGSVAALNDDLLLFRPGGGDCTSTLVAVDATTGEVVWSTDFVSDGASTMQIDGHPFVRSWESGKTLLRDGITGEIVHEGRVVGAADGGVLVGSGAELVFVELPSLAERWRTEIPADYINPNSGTSFVGVVDGGYVLRMYADRGPITAFIASG